MLTLHTEPLRTAAPTPELSPRQVALLAAAVDVVDVRDSREYDRERIPGSRHVELGDLARELWGLDPERPVVFCCGAGRRCHMATDAARTAGVEAFSLRGGIRAWARCGLPLHHRAARIEPVAS